MKIFIQHILNVLVIFSLLAPAVLPLIEGVDSIFMVVEINEENQKKESKKELSEKDFFVPGSHLPTTSQFTGSSAENFAYLEKHLTVATEIDLPPPEVLT